MNVCRWGLDRRYLGMGQTGTESQDIAAPERVVLFVCTGNTCRSPMGEAIARHLLARRSNGKLTIVESAGTDAGRGSPMSPEAVRALRSMGIEARAHRSRRLTRKVAARADVIFALTPGHLQSLLAIDPTAADRAHTLDPSGVGVIDPIGQSQAFYDETAAQIRSLIEGRLSEILR